MPLAGDFVDREENSRHPSPLLRFRTIWRPIFSSDLDACPSTCPAPCEGFPPCCAELHQSGAAQAHPLGARPASSSGSLIELQNIPCWCGKVTASGLCTW